MKKFLDEFLEVLYKAVKENSDLEDLLNYDGMIDNLVPEIAKQIKESLRDSTKEMLEETRKLTSEFELRNIERWRDALDIFEVQIIICTEIGDKFNDLYRPKFKNSNDFLVFDIIVRHHARACQISQEILSLLKSGFADAAQARWRALHEVNVTAMFIKKHGRECAERFYYHEIIDSYNLLFKIKKHEDCLEDNLKFQNEFANCKKDYESLKNKYGEKFASNYGWASYIFPNHSRLGFAAIEKDVGIDHLRPYYSWASHNIHSGSKGMRDRLGLCETNEDILLVGQSQSGMTEPAQSTAKSLFQITKTLLSLKPTLDNLVLEKIVSEYSDEVSTSFENVESYKNI